MDSLQKENERLSKKSNLSKSIDDVQLTIDLLTNARDSIRASMYKLFGMLNFPHAAIPFTALRLA
jgi:hypothetical protein